MRRAPAEIRELEPDPVFRSTLVTQLINNAGSTIQTYGYDPYAARPRSSGSRPWAAWLRRAGPGRPGGSRSSHPSRCRR